MTVANLIKQLQKLPAHAKVAVDVSYSGKKEWTYEMVNIKPRLERSVDMHEENHIILTWLYSELL